MRAVEASASGNGAHEPHLAGESVRWRCQGPGSGEIGEVLCGETRLPVKLACATGDALERPLQALAECGVGGRQLLDAHAAAPVVGWPGAGW